MILLGRERYVLSKGSDLDSIELGFYDVDQL